MGAAAAVWATRVRRDRRRVRVECYFGVTATGSRALCLEATNCDRRAVSLSTIGLLMADGSHMVPAIMGTHGRLPVVLAEGESVSAMWTAAELRRAGTPCLYGYVRDSMLNVIERRLRWRTPSRSAHRLSQPAPDRPNASRRHDR